MRFKMILNIASSYLRTILNNYTELVLFYAFLLRHSIDSISYAFSFLNQAHAWFLEIALVHASVMMCVYVCQVCLSAPVAINN